MSDSSAIYTRYVFYSFSFEKYMFITARINEMTVNVNDVTVITAKEPLVAIIYDTCNTNCGKF